MNLLDLVVTIKADDQASSQVSGISQDMIAKGTMTGNLMSAGIAAGVAAVTAGAQQMVSFVSDSVQTGREFDASMSQVAATMGLTTDQISELRDTALDMGSSTAFSATQAAEALNYMALAGYDSETSMKMLPNVLNLAAAGAMDLGAASDMVTDSQTALGLSLEETEVLIDQMAKASSKSNTSVSQLGEAILTVGGTAKNLAGGTTELNTVLGILADNGIKGSEAGTHLRNIMLSLSSPTDAAAKALESLGVQAFDADGNMRPLEDTFLDLQDALDGMTSEQRSQALSTIFNKTDLSSVNALLSTSADRWDELGAAIDDCGGAASQMADTQLNNLEGDLTLMQSAIEGTEIALSDMLTPSLREMAGAAGDSFTAVAAALRNGDILSAATELGRMVTTIATQIISNIPQIIDAGLKLVLGLITGFAQGLPQMIPAIVQALVGVVNVIIENIPIFIEAAMQLVMGLAEGLIRAIPVLLEAVPQIIETLVMTLLEGLPQILETGIQLFMQLVDALIEVGPQILEGLLAVTQSLISLIIEHLPEILNAALKFFTMIFNAIVNKGPQILSGLLNVITSLLGLIIQNLPNILSKAGEFFGKIVTAIANKAPEILSAIGQLLLDILSKIGAKFGDMLSKGKEFLGKMLEGVKNKATEVLNWFRNLPQSILSALGNLGSLLWNAGSQIIGGLLSGIKNAVQGVFDFVSGIGSTIASLKGPEEYDKALLIPNGGWIMEGLATGLEKGFPQVKRELKSITNDIASTEMGVPSITSSSTMNNHVGGSVGGRSFVFNVTVNNDGQAQDAGRSIAQSLYKEMQRRELNYA